MRLDIPEELTYRLVLALHSSASALYDDAEGTDGRDEDVMFTSVNSLKDCAELAEIMITKVSGEDSTLLAEILDMWYDISLKYPEYIDGESYW